jgi:Tol biopolymer transport system component
MGEVYRAHDTKLKRDVALKILPDFFANDPDRLARFQREAQVLASLNHPNIAHIHGLEESAGVRALVLELVDGEDLAQRVARASIPLDEALPIAKQIAEALEAAHEQGIIHRDLKPANIKVRPDGTVKVLDFGLAKAMEPVINAANVSQSPTITTPAMTHAGIILGTAAYMSPEQAAGKTLDRRSDLWSFGVVLLEMLTGRPVFRGETVSHVLASVLTKEPDWTALPTNTPAVIRTLLRRCLQKDRKRRLADAADVRLEIEDAITALSAGDSADVQSSGTAARSARSRAVPWTIAGLACAAAATILALWWPSRSAPVPTSRKLLASIGADASLLTGLGAAAILSPDGTALAFVAQQAGQTRLFIRKLDQLQASAVAGTEGAASPFFSPDGQWIAFFAGGKLMKIPVTGGATINLCDAAAGRGGTWADDDTIIFTPAGVNNTRLLRVPATGGTPGVFGTFSPGMTTQRWPQALPGRRGLLYTEHSSISGFDGANLVVAPLTGGPSKVVVRGGYFGRYLLSGLGSPTRAERGSGHLVYMYQGMLFAVRFDLDRLEPIGQAVPALEGVNANPANGSAQLAFSSEGTLVYVPGTTVTTANRIEWMTREGETSVLRATKADWMNPRFSPAGKELAIEISDGKQRDIWVYDWAQDTVRQLTFAPAQDRVPVWTPDGRRLVFSSDRATAGIFNLYWVNADGTGDVTRITESSQTQLALSWHPSGKFLAFQENRGATASDLMILPMEGDARGWRPGQSAGFLSTSANEVDPMFSSDGRWIAYVSNEGGGYGDVYVSPYPGPGGKWRVSTEGGVLPHWSPTSQELLFLDESQSKVMVAPYVVVGNSFRAGKPHVWSPTKYRTVGNAYPYDVHPDGKRLAITGVQDQENVVQDRLVIVSNFFDYLREIAPGRK